MGKIRTILVNKKNWLFIGGLLGTLHETILYHGERSALLLLFGYMMGLPIILPTLGHHIHSRSHQMKQEEKDQD